MKSLTKGRKGLRRRIRRIFVFMHRKNFLLLLMILTLLIGMSGVGFAVLEPNASLVDGLWWSIVTLTTVGYGDITPTTTVGRLAGILIMFFGIGMLMMFTATIASVFVKKELKEERGMGSYNFENHIIISELLT